ncbi:MAG: VWA domain-containing protein [Bacteroidota bacterium]|nr:VWA domain-containing protein [Bacteroidota bacterium]
MFRFENPSILLFLLIVPIGVLLFVLLQHKKKKQLNQAIDFSLQNQVIPLLSFGKQRLKFILLCLAYIFVVMAASNPQIASTLDKQNKKGSEIIICLDVSNSMLAQDLTPNRLEKAKLALGQLISQMQNDKIGIVLFAGSAYTFLPLTSDYATARMFCDVISTELISHQGTNIEQALSIAAQTFGENKTKNNSRTIILISDGEDNQPESFNIVEDIAKQGISVNCIGIGNPQGANIPVMDENGNTQYKRDKKGNIVVSKLNEDMLKQIASEGKGIYTRADKTSLGLNAIVKAVKKMDKQEYTALAYRDYNSVAYLFAFVGLLLLLLDWFIFSSKHRVINRKFFFGKE